ncbi:hypothetical protein SKAU_G00428070 [Synaphobranchus kaupii]|uniref:Uncharacterized protein n=1 Tax=Synaphobranchus kaupii TaxID=118154 RepID=A0A9Q1E4R8_SYNKA|nr:hypothetical protein SKAU_G00428070 [Synaphobranchus kaupii]
MTNRSPALFPAPVEALRPPFHWSFEPDRRYGTNRSGHHRDIHSFPQREAILQENIQHLELEELKRQVLEDCNADLECQRLATQAREAQCLQQEAREAIAKRLDRQRLLKRKEKELQVAKLVTSLL